MIKLITHVKQKFQIKYELIESKKKKINKSKFRHGT